MQFYSQRDPSYGALRLGKSKLTISSHGCFVSSLAMLYQKHPREIIAIPGGITDSGLVVSGAIAKACGGEALPKTDVPPQGWCIAMTNHYAPDFPTHFFVVHPQKKLQIDPLDFPCQPEPLTYRVLEYRPFTNVKLVLAQTWQEEAIQWSQENGIIALTSPDGSAPMSEVRTMAALKKFKERFIP